MSDTERSQIENESCALERGAECLLIDGNIVNKHVSDGRAYLVPFRAVIGEPRMIIGFPGRAPRSCG